MIPLDPESWGRSPLLEKYWDYVFPYINIGAEVDVTGLYRYAKENGLSFYCAMIHTAVRAAWSVLNFRYRILDGKPVLCEALTPVFTYLPKGEEQFYLVSQPYEEDLASYCKKAKALAKQKAAEKEHSYGNAREDLEILYITCIPWIRYTHFVRTVKNAKEDTVPRISWGKYSRLDSGAMTVPLSVQVHHALMDGYHVGMFFEKLEELLSEF